jgi:Na+/proline symporter
MSVGFWVLTYLVVTLVVGLLTSRLVNNSNDFLNANRQVPLLLSSFALFAFWFGSETIFGATSEFIQHGLLGVIEDPFGGFLCLFLFALIFVRPLYRQNILTLGDLFRKRYGRRIEIISSFFMLITFFGYVAAQIIALSILFESVFDINAFYGKLLSAGIVTIYTAAGGMWAVSITDFIQSIVIVAGLLFLCIDLTGLVEIDAIFNPPQDHFFDFFPDAENQGSWLDYIAAWLTLGLGSLASQDIFQRANAAKTEKIAVRSTYFGAILYLIIAMMPLYLGLLIFHIDPDLAEGDQQYALVSLVAGHAPFWLQVLFYGALISAIFSTCSGSLLAPSSILAENIIKPFFLKNASDKQFLLVSRLSVVAISVVATLLAYGATSIYELVAQSSILGLVSILVPMFVALFFRNASKAGAFLSMVSGLMFYLFAEFQMINFHIPPLFVGFGFSVIGMIAGQWLVKKGMWGLS